MALAGGIWLVLYITMILMARDQSYVPWAWPLVGLFWAIGSWAFVFGKSRGVFGSGMEPANPGGGSAQLADSYVEMSRTFLWYLFLLGAGGLIVFLIPDFLRVLGGGSALKETNPSYLKSLEVLGAAGGMVLGVGGGALGAYLGFRRMRLDRLHRELTERSRAASTPPHVV
jgi:hypothetical protein